MAHVQTVLGPIEPDALGFTLPHEHTQIVLWQIEGRWDYWQLTRDEPVILAELASFRDAGGSGLVGRGVLGGEISGVGASGGGALEGPSAPSCNSLISVPMTGALSWDPLPSDPTFCSPPPWTPWAGLRSSWLPSTRLPFARP